MTTTATPSSGTQYTIRYGNYTAEIATVGATLRSLRHSARNLIVPFSADSIRPCFHGSILSPWPNRLEDGAFNHEGTTHQLPLSEPERCNALHGLVLWQQWGVVSVSTSAIELSTTIAPQPGYPWFLDIRATYSLSNSGLLCSITATNIGSGNAPYGIGTHPYLTAGSGTVDDWLLEIPANTVLESTPGRLLPKTLHPVSEFWDAELDFREPRPINSTQIDHAYTDIHPTNHQLSQVKVLTPEGEGAILEWDAAQLPWVQIFTSDLTDPRTNRTGIAVEAMTCAPNAFNNKQGLLILHPHEHHKAEWTVRAV